MPCVLIVEDDLTIRLLLNSFLADEGFDTLLADNGRAGLELAGSRQPDVILMDIMLPVMDGITAIGLLRQDPSTRDIRIVAMSANMAAVHHSLALEVEAVIGKPFDLDILLDVVQAQSGPRPNGATRYTDWDGTSVSRRQ